MKVHAPAALCAVAALALGEPAAHADAVTDWNATLIATMAGQNPFAQARFAAITHLAMFEAVNAIGHEYHPYLGTIQAPAAASREAAAAAAAHAVLTHYFPASAASLDAALAASLAAVADGPAEDDGVAVGEVAAAAMIAHRSADGGTAPPQFHLPSSADVGEWQLTPACPPLGGVFVHWRELLPFGIDSTDQFRSPPPPPIKSGAYAKAYNEVKLVGSLFSTARPQDRADVAVFYNAALAPFVWNSVARQLAAARGTSIAENARVFALMNMALSDGLASVMETKYHYTFWRPETAIRAGDSDGNAATSADPNYVPFIVTPCFPSYGSAHASASYAARTVLGRVFGEGPHAITLATPALPSIVLQYGRLEQITHDIDDARVYSGIHFRFDQVAGARQGARIGRFVVSHNLQPVHGGGGSNNDDDRADDYDVATDDEG